MPDGHAPKPAKISQAKGKPWIHWVGKRGIEEIAYFPAQETERFDPHKGIEQGKWSETQIYWRTPGHSRRLSFWLEDIAETATKAVTRGEKLLAKAAISAIENLVIHYLSARKDNLSLHHRPDTLFVVESDVKQVTSCAYEALKEISRNAVGSVTMPPRFA